LWIPYFFHKYAKDFGKPDILRKSIERRLSPSLSRAVKEQATTLTLAYLPYDWTTSYPDRKIDTKEVEDNKNK